MRSISLLQTSQNVLSVSNLCNKTTHRHPAEVNKLNCQLDLVSGTDLTQSSVIPFGTAATNMAFQLDEQLPAMRNFHQTSRVVLRVQGYCAPGDNHTRFSLWGRLFDCRVPTRP